jgi:predicted HTH transcriptional regulator
MKLLRENKYPKVMELMDEHENKETCTVMGEISRPVPPSDMWEQLDKLAAEPIRPANAFTREEFMQRYGLQKSQALAKLRILIGAGKVQQVGPKTASNSYYILVEAK